MTYQMDAAAVVRVESYFAEIGTCLRDMRKRESFAIYALGILGDGERKSMEPIAARACGDPDKVQMLHDKLVHFVSKSEWDDQAVRRVDARYALAAMSTREPVTTWVEEIAGKAHVGAPTSEHIYLGRTMYVLPAGKVSRWLGKVFEVLARLRPGRSRPATHPNGTSAEEGKSTPIKLREIHLDPFYQQGLSMRSR